MVSRLHAPPGGSRLSRILCARCRVVHVTCRELGLWSALGPGAWGLGPGAWGLGPGAWGLGPGAWGLGPGAWGLGPPPCLH